MMKKKILIYNYEVYVQILIIHTSDLISPSSSKYSMILEVSPSQKSVWLSVVKLISDTSKI